jgi:hypothetical protein
MISTLNGKTMIRSKGVKAMRGIHSEGATP